MSYMFFNKKEYDKFAILLAKTQDSILALSAEKREEIKASFDDSRVKVGEKVLPVGYRKDGSTAFIPVKGVLMPESDPWLSYFGVANTGYDQLIASILEADSDSSVDLIVYESDTPGGYVNGGDVVAEVMNESTKPSETVVYGQCCSMGYYLGSQTDKITARSKGAVIGSIGVLIETYDTSEYYAKEGVKSIVLTNTLSSEKRADLSTVEGQAIVIDHLNDLYGVFEERATDGREGHANFSLANLRSLKGRAVTAKKALNLGLIDVIMSRKEIKIENKSNLNKDGKMDEKAYLALCAEQPTLKAYVDSLVVAGSTVTDPQALEDAEKKGATGESERFTKMLAIARIETPKAFDEAIEKGESYKDFAVTVAMDPTVLGEAPEPAPKGNAPKANGGKLPKIEPNSLDTELPSADASALQKMQDRKYGKRVN